MEQQQVYTDLEKQQPKDWEELHTEFMKTANDIGLKDSSENFVKWMSRSFKVPQVK